MEPFVIKRRVGDYTLCWQGPIVQESRKRGVYEETAYIVSAHWVEQNDIQIGPTIIQWELEVSGSGYSPSWDKDLYSDKEESLAVVQGKTLLYRYCEEEHPQASPKPYISIYTMQGSGRQLRKDIPLPSTNRVDSLLSHIDDLRRQRLPCSEVVQFQHDQKRKDDWKWSEENRILHLP